MNEADTRPVDADTSHDDVRHFHPAYLPPCTTGQRCKSLCGVMFVHRGRIFPVGQYRADHCPLCVLAREAA